MSCTVLDMLDHSVAPECPILLGHQLGCNYKWTKSMMCYCLINTENIVIIGIAEITVV